MRIHLLIKMAELEARLMAGATEKIQLGAFLAIFQVNQHLSQFTIPTSIIYHHIWGRCEFVSSFHFLELLFEVIYIIIDFV